MQWRCFLAPVLQRYVQTPYFIFNSRFDSWQLNNELQVPCMLDNKYPCPPAEQRAIEAYGNTFLDQLNVTMAGAATAALASPQNGGFITSCVCHGCPWESPTLALGNRTPYSAFAAWYSGATSGAASWELDRRGPNGDGAVPATEHCLLVQTCCIDVNGHGGGGNDSGTDDGSETASNASSVAVAGSIDGDADAETDVAQAKPQSVRPVKGGPQKQVMGFGSGSNWPQYDWTVVTTYVPTESTNGFEAIDPAMVKLAHSHGARVVPFAPGTEPVGLPLTGDAAVRAKWVAATVAGLQKYGLDGVNFDYEEPLASNDPKVGWYTALVAETTAAIHAAIPGGQVSVDVGWNPNNVDGRNYDILGLADASDYL